MATAKKKTTAKKSPAKKTAAKKSPTAKKTATKKSPAKKTAAAKKTPVVRKKAVASLPPPPMKSAEERRREEAQALALKIAAAGLEKKAERVEIIDVVGKVDYTDFLVLMSGRVDRQVQAIAGAIEDELRTAGVRARTVEGMRQGQWVIVDFGDVCVHVFQEEERRHRDLESLWMDARRVPVEQPGAREAAVT